MRHRTRRIGDVGFAPCDRNVGLHLAQFRGHCPGLFDLSRLRQAGAQDAIGGGEARPLPDRLPAPVDRVPVTQGQVMGDAGAGIIERRQRVVRA